MIEEAKVTNCHFEKGLEKQKKMLEDQGGKQIKATEEHGKQLVESNELIKNDFTINRDGISLRKQKRNI